MLSPFNRLYLARSYRNLKPWLFSLESSLIAEAERNMISTLPRPLNSQRNLKSSNSEDNRFRHPTILITGIPTGAF